MTMRRSRTGLLLAVLGLCLGQVQIRAQGTELGGGVVTRTNQELWADLPLDIRIIKERIENKKSNEALDIYLNGRIAQSAPGVFKSLQSLTDELVAGSPSDATPNYLYQLYGLAGRSTDFNSLKEQGRYAENYIRAALTEGYEYSGDAILVLNVWMYATHLLYNGMHKCQKLINADEQGLFQLGGGGMDEFIALWISHDGGTGTSGGSGLYSLTNYAAELFGTESGEANANTAIKQLFHEGTVILSFPNVCTTGDARTVPQLWSVVQRMTSQMMVPLIQLLIDSLMEENAERVKFHALAVIPQVSQCRPSIYKKLKAELLGNTVSFAKNQEIISELQRTYDCFGLTCADIGAYKQDQVPQCEDFPINYPMAEYTPTTQVHSHAKIDLDILQVRILTSLQSYSFAKYLYSHGRNSPLPRKSSEDAYELRSLEKFALTPEREAANPFYNDFVEYFDDTHYGHTAVINALQGKGKYGAASPEARTEVVANTCAYQIMYMYALAEMADAIQDCQSKDALDNVGGVHSWDEVAAFLIGSLEGPTEGGSADTDDGQLMWNLANKRAFQFQTLNEGGYSTTNSKLEDLLFAGGGELDAYNCASLKKTVTGIQHILLIPVIQSTLRYAVESEKLEVSNLDKTVAEGETFALSVIPVIKSYDANAAQVIAENMVVDAGVKPVRDGAQVVADAFYEALDEFGISCLFVGASSQVDACRKEGGFSASVRLQPSGYILSAVLIAACVIVL